MNNNITKMYKAVILILLFTCTYLSGLSLSYANETSFPEAKVKAALIYNFLRFVDWPKEAAETGIICVIASKQEYKPAFQFLTTQQFNNKTISVREYGVNDDLSGLEHCQLVFLTNTASRIQKDVIHKEKQVPFLIVSDGLGSIDNVGMINFVKTKRKIGFEINVANVEASNIRISSKVLRLAERLIR
ncbi:MAG: hypothetical protein COA90_10045 [Gammaproteobacteria bacterium]|nr:MAG: hypothetical protein COA90_10045 [Gammaproteobacteria bacterium]